MATEATTNSNVRHMLFEQLVTVWKRRWLALAVAWGVCVLGWAIVMAVPQSYESDARVYVDVNGLLEPLLRGLVVGTTPEQSESYLRQTLLSRPNLEQVILLSNLGGVSLDDIRRQELVDNLARAIKVTTQGDNLVAISYANPNPVVAKNVLDALLTIFAEKAANSSRAEMDKAQNFLNTQIADYEARLRKAEQDRADFRKKYAAYFNDAGVAQPDLLRQQLAQIEQQYQEALAARGALATQMRQVPQLLNVQGAPSVSSSGEVVVASPEVRLSQAQRNLADLRLRYTDSYPDVVSAKHMVDELQGQVSATRGHGSLEGKTQISNPTYEQLRMKMIDIDAQLPVLKTRLDKVTQDYNQAKTMGDDLPDVAAKSQGIDRDYEVLKQNYEELLKRREAANLSQAADNRADRTQFRIVDPPQVPIFAAFPNRLVLCSLVLIAGLAAGLLAPIALAQYRPTFGSTSRLRDLGLPVLGAVTVVRSAQPSGLLQSRASRLYAAAVGTLALLYGGLVLITAGT
jgi:polysaccharide chain length determinant protein (PEP-CTERM system associated)